MLAASVCESAADEPQDDLQAKVSQAISRPFPKEAEASRKQLLALGTPAIPFIAEAVRSSEYLTPIKKVFLIDVMAGIKGQQLGPALVSLLVDDDPLVRGQAAAHLGKQRLKAAIPHLINLLNDRGVYKTTVQTDPAAEQAVLVRDVAIEALQSATGIALAQWSSKDEQVRAWLCWWQKQQK